MSVESRRPLRVGATYPFRVHQKGEATEVSGVVRWCKLQRMIDIGSGEYQTLYRSGIAFSATAPDSSLSVGVAPQAAADSLARADGAGANEAPERSGGRKRLPTKDRKRIQASLADLVDEFIKSMPPES
jgi:hypothetical protein